MHFPRRDPVGSRTGGCEQGLKFDPCVILSRILRRPLKTIYHQQIAHLIQYGVCYQSITIYIGCVIQG